MEEEEASDFPDDDVSDEEFLDVFHDGSVQALGKSRKLDDFEVLEELGSGSYGKVLKVKHKIDEHLYALKVIPLPQDEASRKRALRECKRLAQVDHPGIVRYHNSWMEEGETAVDSTSGSEHSGSSESSKMSVLSEEISSTCLYIQMELCGETLQSYLSSLPNDMDPLERLRDNLQIFDGVVDALAYMHNQGLIHRDIKPDNILRSLKDPDQFKIGDWGSVKGGPMEDSEDDGDCVFSSYSDYFGTLGYLAPEVKKKTSYGAKIDVYALGNVLLHLILPGATAQEFGQRRKAIVEGLSRNRGAVWPKPLHDALKNCFTEEAKVRISLQELKIKVGEAKQRLERSLELGCRFGAPYISPVKETQTEVVAEAQRMLGEGGVVCLQGAHGNKKNSCGA